MSQDGHTVGELETLFDACREGRCHKWRHYFEIYERYLAKYRYSKCVYVEIGVEKGGSLDIMARYLGDQARVIGVDISPACKDFKKKGYEIYTGDQADGRFLHELASRVGAADIIVDDGGHTPDQQITSFFILFPDPQRWRHVHRRRCALQFLAGVQLVALRHQFL